MVAVASVLIKTTALGNDHALYPLGVPSWWQGQAISLFWRRSNLVARKALFCQVWTPESKDGRIARQSRDGKVKSCSMLELFVVDWVWTKPSSLACRLTSIKKTSVIYFLKVLPGYSYSLRVFKSNLAGEYWFFVPRWKDRKTEKHPPAWQYYQKLFWILIPTTPMSPLS